MSRGVRTKIDSDAPDADCSQWKCKDVTTPGIKWLNKIQLNPLPYRDTMRNLDTAV